MSDSDATTDLGGASPIAAGSVFGAWKLDSYVARGGLAVVWLGHDADGNRAAIKILVNAAGRSRFLREHALASAQDGHWTPRVLGANLTASVPWIAFEYLNDHTLEDQAPLPPAHLRTFALNLWLAISSLHLAGIAHRDITPRNVFIDAGEVKLIDFGLAKQDQDTEGFTEHALGGTPGFAAPEQFDGDEAGQSADIWAWGAVVYFAATGAQVYSTRGTRHKSWLSYTQALRERNPSELTDAPAWLQPALESALQMDPSERSRDKVSSVLPASDKDRHFMKVALRLFQVQGAQVEAQSQVSGSGAARTVLQERSPEIEDLWTRVAEFERTSLGASAEEERKNRRVAAIVGAVVALSTLAAGAIGLLGGGSDDSTQTDSTAVSSLLRSSEPDPGQPSSTTDPLPVADPDTETETLVSQETENTSASAALASMNGAPGTTDRGTVFGLDRPGAMSIRLDKAGCSGTTQEFDLQLPDGTWQIVGSVALSDDTPSEANVEVVIGDGRNILTQDRRNASFTVDSVTESLGISTETLSAFGSTCGEMPVEVLIFDSFIR